MSLDTLKYAEELESGGLSREIAHVQAVALRNAVDEHVPTKDWLEAQFANQEKLITERLADHDSAIKDFTKDISDQLSEFTNNINASVNLLNVHVRVIWAVSAVVGLPLIATVINHITKGG